MKTYNLEEFRDEVLKRTGWTSKQLEEHHDRRAREREQLRLDEEDLELYVKTLMKEGR